MENTAFLIVIYGLVFLSILLSALPVFLMRSIINTILRNQYTELREWVTMHNNLPPNVSEIYVEKLMKIKNRALMTKYSYNYDILDMIITMGIFIFVCPTVIAIAYFLQLFN